MQQDQTPTRRKISKRTKQLHTHNTGMDLRFSEIGNEDESKAKTKIITKIN